MSDSSFTLSWDAGFGAYRVSVPNLLPNDGDQIEVVDAGAYDQQCARGDRYLKALHQVAWRLHLALGDELYEPEIEAILEHLDAGLPFGAPE